MSDTRATVAVIGDGHAPEDSDRAAIAYALGAGIIARGHRLITGGLGGVMRAASRGARESDRWFEGAVIGLLPGGDTERANSFVDTPIATSMGHMRNTLVAQADAVIAVGGGAGTLSELAMAWIHDRLIIALRCGGWSERLADERVDERVRLGEAIACDRVWGASDVDEALDLLDRWMVAYRAARKISGRHVK